MTDYIVETLSDSHSESELFNVLFCDPNKASTWYRTQMSGFHKILNRWKKSKYCEVFVALDSSRRIVGLVRIDGNKHQRRKHVGIIGPIAVLPEFHRHGIGSVLVEACVRYCEDSGITRIEARTSVSTPQAVGFFLANGFQKEGLEEKAILDDEGVPHDLTRLVRFI